MAPQKKKPASQKTSKPTPNSAPKTATKTAVKKSDKAPIKNQPSQLKSAAAKSTSTSTSKTLQKPPHKNTLTTNKTEKPPHSKSSEKAPTNNSEAGKLSNEQRIKHALKKLTGSGKNTPAIFKLPSKRHTPVSFSLNEIRQLIKTKSKTEGEEKTQVKTPLVAKKSSTVKMEEPERKPQTFKSATLDDLLGNNKKKPTNIERARDRDETLVPQKWLPYYKKLTALRDKLSASVGERTEQTLRSSSKDTSGDLSSYSQHIADAGTDAFDTDFALSLVSSDQQMVREVDAAIDRIFNGTYGVCEVTGKPIARERLSAVPFTRFSKEGQDEFEKTRRRSSQRVGISSDEDDEVASSGGDDDASEA